MLEAAYVGSLVKPVLLACKVHKAAHQARVGKVGIVEREHARRLRAEHVVKINADGNAFKLARLFHCFVNICLKLREAAFTVDVGNDSAERFHALAGHVKLLQGLFYHGDAAYILVDLAQAVDERPKRRSLLILLETRHIL